MRLTLLAVGRLKNGPERELLTRYADRAAAMCRPNGFAGLTLREVDEGHGRGAPERMREETRRLSAELPDGTLVFALDERGSSLSSPDFARALGEARDAGRAGAAVLVGGPDGLDPSWRTGSARLVAYGAATFPHGLVRVLAAEQIYRALTILAGHPYHRG